MKIVSYCLGTLRHHSITRTQPLQVMKKKQNAQYYHPGWFRTSNTGSS